MASERLSVFRSYLIFAIVAAGLLMASIDGTIVAVALPAMLRELDVGLALLSWTITSYQLTQTISLPLAGKLADKWGRKRVFLMAVLIFTLGSVGAGLSPNIYALIVFRVLQGMGGGMFFPSVAGVIGDVFKENRQTPIGLVATTFQLGSVIGPNVGGLITDHLSWRWIFFVNLPVGAAILLLGLRFLPRDLPRSQEPSKPFDYTGMALFASGIFTLLFGLTYLASHPDHLDNPMPWLSIAVAVVLLAMLVRQELHAEEPVIDMRLLSWKPMLGANMQIFMGSASFNGFFNFMPYYATIAYGMTATQAGAFLTPRSLTAIIVSLAGSFLIVTLGYRRPWLTGNLLFAAAVFATSFGLSDITILGVAIPNFLLLSSLMCVAGFGIGLSGPPSNNAALDLIPERIAGIAGLRAMFGNSGAVLGTTLVTLVLSRFSNKVDGMHYIFLGLGCTIVLATLWIFLVPDTAWQRRQERRAQEREAELVAAGGG